MDNFSLEVDNFMLYCTSKNLSTKSMRSYDQTLKLFSLYLSDQFNVTDVKNVKAEHIRSYINYTRQRGKYTLLSNKHTSNNPQSRKDFKKQVSETTLANYLRNLKVFFNFLYRDKRIRKNPVSNIPSIKPQRKMKPLLSKNELYMLMRAFDTSTFHGYRDWMITRLILDTGCRVGECLNLTPANVDIKNHCILLNYTKNGKERFVYFSFKTGRNLKSWMEYLDRYTDGTLLFPSIHGRKQDIRNYEVALRKAGESVGISVAPHQLRNNFAKYYLLNGGDFATLSRILGHSSIEVTRSAYLDFTDKEIGTNYQKHSPLENLDI